MKPFALISIVGMFLVAGIIQPQDRTDPALAIITKQIEAAYNSGDAARVASFYAEDAVMMPPHHPMVKGRSAIEAHVKGSFQQVDATLAFSPLESSTAGDLAFEAGTSTAKLSGDRTVSEKYLVVYKRVGNQWKIAYDMWNSDAALRPEK